MVKDWIAEAVEFFGSEAVFSLVWSAGFILLAALVLVVHHSRRLERGGRSVIRVVEDNLVVCASVIFLCGFGLYGIAYCNGTNAGNLVVLLPKVVISSIRMFVSSGDLMELRSPLKSSVLFMTIFTVVHLSALTISAMVLLKVLGYRVESYLRMRFANVREKTLVFWGVNENSLMLAESIPDKDRCTIIFVDLPKSDFKRGNLLQGIIGNDGISKEHIFKLERMGAYLTKANCRFNDLNSGMPDSSEKKDVYTVMGIKSLRKFVRNVEHVNFYFLSDCEQDNMDNLMAIVKFFGAENIDGLPLSRIYCHARYTTLNNIIDRLLDKITFVDSSKLSILQLLKDVRHQPANFVEKDTCRGVVTSGFNALVIGFGEVGRDAFKFIYEFSSFIGEGGEPAPRMINVMDLKLSELKARFLNNSPALRSREDISWWDDMSINSERFWERYMSMVGSVNYIVVALNDDRMAADLAVKLYETAYRYRGDMRNFRIFAAVKDAESAGMLRRASDYYRVKSNREDNGENVIVPFGVYKTLFDSDIFDTEVVAAESKRFSSQYYDIYSAVNRELNPAAAPKPQNVAADIKRDADRQQDISNVRHVYTKLILAGAYGPDGRIDDERLAYLQHISKREGMTYVNAQPGVPEMLPAYTLMENLSLCEHLRWNAKMELLGFLPLPYNPETDYCGRDYDLKKHECIVPCRELNAIPKFHATKVFDWAVVELSFRFR